MRKIRKSFLKKNKILWFLFFAFSCFFWFSRLWRFEELMTFHLDQALFMREVWAMFETGKISLVGPMVISKVALGRGFFIGPYLYYILGALCFLTDWNVVLITKILLSVWWLAGLAMFFLFKKRFSFLSALFSYAVFVSFPFFIDYSRFIWNPHFTPLIGTAFLWIFLSLWEKNKKLNWFLLGLSLGIGIDFHYGMILWGVLALVLLIKRIFDKEYLQAFLGGIIFTIGVIIGNFPVVLFELRHSFYNINTIFFFLKHSSSGGFGFAYYFLFPFLSIFFLFLSWIVLKLEKKFGVLKVVLLMLLIFLFFIFKIDWNKKWGTGMPEGWNIEKQQKIAEIICADVKENNLNGRFEIAATISEDTRAGDLHWWAKRLGCDSLGVEKYPQTDVIYLIAYSQRPPETETVWEISSFRPFEIIDKKDLKDNIFYYKLKKVN